MLSHPAFLSAEVGCNAERKALLAEPNVSAVARVDRPDGVVLREVADIAVLLIEVSLCVQTLDEVGTVAEGFENVVADSRHNQHVEDDIDRVGQLNAVLGEVGADDTHGVGNDIHRLALHGAGEQLG